VLSDAGRPSWDGLGQLLSALCIAHCVLLPLVLGVLPTLAVEMLEGEAVHQGLVSFAALSAAAAFLPGWRLHRRADVPGLAVTGLVLLLIAAFFLPEGSSEVLETGLTLGGGVLLAVAHARNRSLCRECCALRPGAA
jgi:hypothetical protein